MLIVGQDILLRAGHGNAPLRKWLANWVAAVEPAVWHSLNDVRKMYPHCDSVKLKSYAVVTAFNVKENEYRLLTLIDYEVQILETLDVLTHAEYDKNAWKLRY